MTGTDGCIDALNRMLNGVNGMHQRRVKRRRISQQKNTWGKLRTPTMGAVSSPILQRRPPISNRPVATLATLIRTSTSNFSFQDFISMLGIMPCEREVQGIDRFLRKVV